MYRTTPIAGNFCWQASPFALNSRHSPHSFTAMKLNWRRPLFYLVLPILVFLAFVGFPPPFPPVRPARPEQTQGEEVDEAEGVDEADGKA
jgi:hypothetical protein